MYQYQYLLFDLDGTLTDPKQGICTCVQYALADAGIEVADLDVLEPFIGPPLLDSFMEFYGMTQEQAQTAIHKYRERFEVQGLYENMIYPGIADMLHHLQALGLHLAVASSKPTVFVERILEHFEIKDCFEVIVGSELDGTRSRKEEVVEETLKRLLHHDKSKYDRCVMIGDRKFDIEGAQRFGMNSIGVTYGYGGAEELKQAGATILVDDVLELEKVLTKELTKETTKETTQPTIRQPVFYKTWQILFPILFYWAFCNIVLLVGVFAVQSYYAGKEVLMSQLPQLTVNQISVYLNTIATAAAIPCLGWMYHREQQSQPIAPINVSFGRLNRKSQILVCIMTIILGVSTALSFNIILSHIDFSDFLSQYEQVATMQYSVPLLSGIIIYGLITPLAEEFVFRGLVCRRIRQYFNPMIAILVSALIFGAYHGNLIQGIYGFLLGVIMALCYQHFNSILIPILFHSAANISVFVMTQNPALQAASNQIWNGVILLIIAGLTWIQCRKIK
ncbi:MAG: HAD hydrolase-like protein [Lachnospiraceae bacterium]